MLLAPVAAVGTTVALNFNDSTYCTVGPDVILCNLACGGPVEISFGGTLKGCLRSTPVNLQLNRTTGRSCVAPLSVLLQGLLAVLLVPLV